MHWVMGCDKLFNNCCCVTYYAYVTVLRARYVLLQAMDKEEMMKRISRQFKLIMQPYYRSGKITKDEYKDVMRKAVPAVR